MHVNSKDVSQDGRTHVLTSVIEADGPFEICSESQLLSGEVVSVRRTVSGGVEIVTKLTLSEPAPTPAPAPETPEPPKDVVLEYLAEKGLNATEAQSAVDRFGRDAILQEMRDEHQKELDALLAKPEGAAGTAKAE